MDRSAFHDFLRNGPVSYPSRFELESDDDPDKLDLFKTLDISKCGGYCRPSMRDIAAQGEQQKFVFSSLSGLATKVGNDCQGCRLILKSAEAVVGRTFNAPPPKQHRESEGRLVPVRLYGKTYVQRVYPDEEQEEVQGEEEGIYYVLDPFIRLITGKWAKGSDGSSFDTKWELFTDCSKCRFNTSYSQSRCSAYVERLFGSQQCDLLLREGPLKGFRQIPQFNQPSGDTASQRAFAKAENWLRECETRHSCNAKKVTIGENALPRRILDVKQGGLFKKIKIIDTTGLTWQSLGPYVCLSHCWGKAALIQTTRANVKDHLRGINMKSLPQTFRDAVVFTQKLGMRYLWIDSLCIVQDDKEDWEKEAEKMASVYSNARLTLAAASASDSRGGLFSKVPIPEKRRVDTTGISIGDRNLYVRRVLPHFVNDELSWLDYGQFPLLDRGWVLQERLLSRRILYFSEHELLWECMECAWCECGGITTESNRYDRVMKKSEFRESWNRIIEAYSSLKLTKQSDKLPALSGIASAFHTTQEQRMYLGGLWSDALPDGLQWTVCKDEILSARTEQFAPKWSWTSVPNRVEFCDENSRCNDSCFTLTGTIFNIKLKDCAAEAKGRNKYGHTEYCYLVFEANGGMGYLQERFSSTTGKCNQAENEPFRIRLADSKFLTVIADYDLSQDPYFDFHAIEADGSGQWGTEASQLVYLVHLCTQFFRSNQYSSIFPTAPRPYNRRLGYLALKLIWTETVGAGGVTRRAHYERLGLVWGYIEEIVECTISMDPIAALGDGRLSMEDVCRNDALFNPGTDLPILLA